MTRAPESLRSNINGQTPRNAESVDSAPVVLPFRPPECASHSIDDRALATEKKGAHILDLANEVLDLILDRIEADPDKGVSVDTRAYLSKESFRSPPQPSSTSVQDLSNWRRTCKRFSELGATHQFARVTTRWEQREFVRLEWLAQQKHLVQHVKKFSYMMPWFYVQGRDRLEDAVPEVSQSLSARDLQVYSKRMNEQRRIVESKEDLQALKKAMSAFKQLQHIKILPVQDDQARRLLETMRRNAQITRFVDIKWGPACSHSTRTIGEALLTSHSPFKRFSSPMISPQSAIGLADHSPGLTPGISDTLGHLASRLTCLEIHFEEGGDLDAKMRHLSPLFKVVFNAAKNLEAVHVGFPSRRPISLKLEDLFHNVRWDNLLAFGIQGWKLDADEIIALAGRHRDRLRGLRLRDVKLNEGSMWKDILNFLRNDMRNLDWVSLRRIGYSAQFDEEWSTEGVEVPDDPPGGYSSDSDDSDDSDDFDDDFEPSYADATVEDHNGSLNHHEIHHENNEYSQYSEQDSTSSEDEDSDDEHGMLAHQMDLPQFSPDTPSSVPWCSCGDNRTDPETAEELGDNGVSVDPLDRKRWEKWAVRRCPEHSLH